jgi:hypothetical protein
MIFLGYLQGSLIFQYVKKICGAAVVDFSTEPYPYGLNVFSITSRTGSTYLLYFDLKRIPGSLVISSLKCLDHNIS